MTQAQLILTETETTQKKRKKRKKKARKKSQSNLYNGLAENCDFKVVDECQTATYFSSIEEGYRFSATRCKLKEQNSSIYAGEVYTVKK